ncbi:hypothetical protein SAMN06295960_4389 [Paenibacillus aquistagni]|uniref:Uncharacterized protein n=1 Tax=Paenibacillus aquistagni TaxID=1852522 RepID=A0A1X7LWE8_9BACL|nr:hypothetical protein SAMN06295960_4389 [Paenibacillus aquistagni]
MREGALTFTRGTRGHPSDYTDMRVLQKILFLNMIELHITLQILQKKDLSFHWSGSEVLRLCIGTFPCHARTYVKLY